MLNISLTSTKTKINRSEYSTFEKLEKRSHSDIVIWIFIGIALIVFCSMFLPWTQNIRSKGYVTTLNPYDKPQNIQSLIGGKIDRWYVKEGDVVAIGDTIAILTEAKEEYLDPDMLDNTQAQQDAKTRTIDAYQSKVSFLREQLTSIEQNRVLKLNQVKIKQQQIDLKIATNKLDLEAADIYLQNATNQLTRMDTMYARGIKSLVDLETKRLSMREARAKKNSLVNKLAELENDQANLLQEINVIAADFDQKISKIESEIQTAESSKFSAQGDKNKLQSKVNQLSTRQDAYIIKSPINGRVTKVLTNGIGQFIKPQQSMATIVPTEFQKAVELYVEPNDMPLIQEGKSVRIQFDGWPAIVFSGWPDNSFGTFGGTVVAIDNDISENGRYRILVTEDPSEKVWPNLIRIGSGANGLLLLNDVKIYYEIWRNLNGFPPDFYQSTKEEEVKTKAPLRKVK